MKTMRDKVGRDVKRMAGFYNMVPNVLWSVLGLVPVSVFCYTWLPTNLFLLFLGVSLLPLFLSPAVMDRLQIARTPATYKQLGIALVQRLSQNGAIINRLIRKRHPAYRALRPDQRSIRGLLNQTYAFEKFHLMLFVFFALATVYALWKGLAGWAVILSLTNLLYNVSNPVAAIHQGEAGCLLQEKPARPAGPWCWRHHLQEVQAE
jgi:hypothetical protein